MLLPEVIFGHIAISFH